jgi:hypothetical protein
MHGIDAGHARNECRGAARLAGGTRPRLHAVQTRCRAIAEAHAVDEVKDIRDKALAIQMYARQAQNTEAERQACDIRHRAERRCGELSRELATAQGHRSDLTSVDDPSKLAALKLAGISRDQATTWERLAAIPEADFEADMADPMWMPTTAGLLARAEARERAPETMAVQQHTAGMDDAALWPRILTMQPGGACFPRSYGIDRLLVPWRKANFRSGWTHYGCWTSKI